MDPPTASILNQKKKKILVIKKKFVSLHSENRGEMLLKNAATCCLSRKDAGVVDRGGLENR